MNDTLLAILIALLICSATVTLAGAITLWFNAPPKDDKENSNPFRK